MNKTPGTSSAVPWSIYLLTTSNKDLFEMTQNKKKLTLFISFLNFSVISVFFGLSKLESNPIPSEPPCGFALA